MSVNVAIITDHRKYRPVGSLLPRRRVRSGRGAHSGPRHGRSRTRADFVPPHSSHRPQPGLQPPVMGVNPGVGVLLNVWNAPGKTLSPVSAVYRQRNGATIGH